jgi:hypothetical protein
LSVPPVKKRLNKIWPRDGDNQFPTGLQMQ